MLPSANPIQTIWPNRIDNFHYTEVWQTLRNFYEQKLLKNYRQNQDNESSQDRVNVRCAQDF